MSAWNAVCVVHVDKVNYTYTAGAPNLLTIFLFLLAIPGEKGLAYLKMTKSSFVTVLNTLPLLASSTDSELFLLLNFEWSMPFYTSRTQKRQYSSWCMEVTECFHSTHEKKKKPPCFWHTGKCTARECLRQRCHPSLTSVCFHLSTTVLIDKTSFPDVIPSRAHMLTSLRHHCWLPA